MSSLSCWRLFPRRRKTALGWVAAAAVIFGLTRWNSTESDVNPGAPRQSPLGRICADWPAYREAAEKDWQKAGRKEEVAEGPGERGAPVSLANDSATQQLADQVYRANGYSGLVSDQIRLDRTVPDMRHPGCRGRKHLAKLPSASVILAFHQEHLSVLLRSCHSVVNRSPPQLLKEIVLVDDFSVKPDLGDKLQKYLDDNLPQVKLIRTKRREGLMRARQIGAEAAVGDVLVFLDAHSEPNHNWLPPLLDPIAKDCTTVVCPFVDVIDCETFEYRSGGDGSRGSFDWALSYKQLPLPRGDKREGWEDYENPVMAGGYFAISRRWFFALGGYDSGLEIWGGEQYEISFKIWQCGGKMIDSPCSRVAHIYRCKYQPFPKPPGVGDFISSNYRRVAEVWMDEAAEWLYARKPEVKAVEYGDVSAQREVRRRLQCRPFSWFLSRVAFDQPKFFPAVEPPDGAWGQLESLGPRGGCLDAMGVEKGQGGLAVSPCGSGREQNFRLSWFGDLRTSGREMCLDASGSQPKAKVLLFVCHLMEGNQHWEFRPDTQQVRHPLSGLCLTADPDGNGIFNDPCRPDDPTQHWRFQHVNTTQLDFWRTKGRHRLD